MPNHRPCSADHTSDQGTKSVLLENANESRPYTRYGLSDVVQIMDVEKPVPKDNEVVIKVRAASLNPADWRLMGGAQYVFRVLFRLRKPTPAEPGRLGHDVAGQFEVVGRNVTRFKPGDPVFGACPGALAEYACASESALIGKPEKLTSGEAASVRAD